MFNAYGANKHSSPEGTATIYAEKTLNSNEWKKQIRECLIMALKLLFGMKMLFGKPPDAQSLRKVWISQVTDSLPQTWLGTLVLYPHGSAGRPRCTGERPGSPCNSSIADRDRPVGSLAVGINTGPLRA